MNDRHAPAAVTDNSGEWRRLSPVAIIFFLFKGLKMFGPDAWPMYAGGFAWFAGAGAEQRTWILLGLLGVLVFILLWGLLSYLRFTYRLGQARVQVRRGVLQREQLTIEFDRIQNVTINEPFYVRPFQRATLEIDTAGSQGEEVSLPGLELAQARQLRERILTRAEGASQRSVQARSETVNLSAVSAQRLASASNSDLVIYGLSSNMAVWVAVIAGPLFTLDFEWWENLDSNRIAGFAEQIPGLGSSIVAVIGLVLSIAVLLILASVIGSFLRFHGYTLERSGRTFAAQSGLLSRHSQSVRQHKIQALRWSQNPVARLFGRFNLKVMQVKAGSVEGAETGQKKQRGFLVPARSKAQAEVLSQAFLQDWKASRAPLTRMDRRFIRTRVVLQALILSPALIAVAWQQSLALLGLIPVTVALLWWLAWLRWQRSGFRVEGGYLCSQQGIFGTRIDLFALYRLQRVDVVQSLFKRRAGLADVTLYLGSHTLNLYFLPQQLALQMRDLAIATVETSELAWI